jgi:hypothetical protein
MTEQLKPEAPVKKRNIVVKESRHPHFSIYLNGNSVLVVEATDMEYESHDVNLVVDTVNKFCGSLKHLVLIEAGDHSTIGFEGLKALARPEAFSYAHAKAYVIKTLPQRLMANFYLKFFPPEVPVKFFGKRSEAEAWLLKKFRHLISTRFS